MKGLKYLFYIASFSLISCIEPINYKVKTTKNFLIVDAIITDDSTSQKIILTQNIPGIDYAQFKSVTNARVILIENDKDSIYCLENPNGNYILPAGFRAKVGKSYQLKIVLEDKETYLSAIENYKPVPEISAIKSVIVPDNYEYDKIKYAAHNLYLTTKSTVNQGNYYLWKWKDFEKQYYCASCTASLFYATPYPGVCKNLARNPPQATYDYNCNTNCWDIYQNTDINIMSDAFVQNGLIKDRLIGPIPLYQKDGALIEISQQVISENAYNYLKLLASQSQSTGTLVDTSPAPLIGNIKNINNKTETVGGYFMVTGSKKYLYWLDRMDAKGYKELGMLKGRVANSEPSGSDLTRPPLAPCVLSNSRTPYQPTGWRN